MSHCVDSLPQGWGVMVGSRAVACDPWSLPPSFPGSSAPPAFWEAGHLDSGGVWGRGHRAQKEEPGGRGWGCQALPVTTSCRQKNTNQLVQI